MPLHVFTGKQQDGGGDGGGQLRGFNESFTPAEPLNPGATADFEATQQQSDFIGTAAKLVWIHGEFLIVNGSAASPIINLQPISDGGVLATPVNVIDVTTIIAQNQFQVVPFHFPVAGNLIGAGSHNVGIRFKNNGSAGQVVDIETTHIIVVEY